MSVTTKTINFQSAGRWGTRLRQLLVLWIGLAGIVVGLPTASQGEAIDVAYSFYDDDSGGAAAVQIDSQTGRIISNEALFDSTDCRLPLKIRRTHDKRHVAVTNLDHDGRQLFLWTAGSAMPPKGLRLPSIPDEVRIAGTRAFVTLEKDAVAAVDLDQQQVVAVHQLDKMLSPPANAPEDLAIESGGQLAVVSFQKDSQSGKKQGNRLVIFELPSMRLVGDLRLPRQLPDLHIAGNLKEQGPGPEVLDISSDTDTLSVTLDLYGALGMLRWSAAKAGRIENWAMVSTGVGDKIDGQSFPDRATRLRLDGRDFYLVCNAGQLGGSVLVDLHKHQVVWRRATPPGLEAPVFIPELRQAFSVCSGKTKRRDGTSIIKTSNPQDELFTFDFPSAKEVGEAEVRAQSVGGLTTQIALVSEKPPMLLIAMGEQPNRADTLITFDPVQGTIKDRQSAVGVVGRFEK